MADLNNVNPWIQTEIHMCAIERNRSAKKDMIWHVTSSVCKVLQLRYLS